MLFTVNTPIEMLHAFVITIDTPPDLRMFPLPNTNTPTPAVATVTATVTATAAYRRQFTLLLSLNLSSIPASSGGSTNSVHPPDNLRLAPKI